MVTTSTHARNRGHHGKLRRVVAGAATAGLTAALSTSWWGASASAAETAPRPTLKTVRTLPFTGTGDEQGAGNGGRGTVRANAAVSTACNGGAPISAPQWYAVGKRTTGSIKASADAVWYPRGIAHEPSGTAVVDHWTGEVLACTGQTAERWSRPVDVVGYLTEPFRFGEDVFFDLTLTVVVDRVSTTKPPANDRIGNPQPVTSLPFSAKVDTSLADADGPALKDYGTCELSNWDPQQGNTVWYSYRPTVTGPAPVVSASPASGWADQNTHGSWGLQTGILEVLPDGGTRLVENEDVWDCETPVPLTAGTDYLIGVYYGWDGYNDSVLATGGPVDVSVTPR